MYVIHVAADDGDNSNKNWKVPLQNGIGSTVDKVEKLIQKERSRRKSLFLAIAATAANRRKEFSIRECLLIAKVDVVDSMYRQRDTSQTFSHKMLHFVWCVTNVTRFEYNIQKKLHHTEKRHHRLIYWFGDFFFYFFFVYKMTQKIYRLKWCAPNIY